MKHLFFSLALVGLVTTTSACSSPPYIHNAGEYNRESAGFGRPVEDISQVTICYSSSEATPRQVSQLAVAECARFNKSAVFSEQSYQVCPLAAPIAAIYTCEGDAGNVMGGSQGIPSGTLMNYDGILFRY